MSRTLKVSIASDDSRNLRIQEIFYKKYNYRNKINVNIVDNLCILYRL